MGSLIYQSERNLERLARSLSALRSQVNWGKLKPLLPGKKRRPPYIIIPIVILSLFLFMGVFGPLMAPHSPTDVELGIRLQPGIWSGEGDWSYPLGTDHLGRDIFSRILAGARVTLTFSMLAIALAGVIGTSLGLIAGYFGRWVDVIVMRLVDLAMSIPFVLLVMILAAAFGAGFTNLVLVVSVLLWAGYARQVRAEVLSLKERDYVAFAKVAGVSTPRILLRHILPNLTHTVVVLATLQVGYVILVEAALSFLGVGIPAPAAVWGSMVADGKAVMNSAWWVATFPGLAIGSVVLSLNLFGDWLRDKLDPRLRQV
jgi:peptide/nickel transport system permease protein